MAKSPSRKDISGTFYVRSSVAEMDDQHFNLIQSACNFAISKEGRVELDFILDNYLMLSGYLSKAPARADIERSLRSMKSDAARLRRFFVEAKDQSEAAALSKIKEELDLMAQPPNQAEACGEVRPVVDTNEFCNALSFVIAAAGRALIKYENEGKQDTGGRNIDEAKNYLVIEIDNFFQRMNGDDDYRKGFFHAVVSALPEGTRPFGTGDNWKWSTVRSHLARARKARATRT